MKGYLTLSRREIGDPHRLAAEHPLHLLQALMRQFQEAVDQPELVHHLQRRGMHGVAAKIAEEVGVLLQHHDIDAGASEQVTEHHAGRAAADDAATYFHRPSRLFDLAKIRPSRVIQTSIRSFTMGSSLERRNVPWFPSDPNAIKNAASMAVFRSSRRRKIGNERPRVTVEWATLIGRVAEGDREAFRRLLSILPTREGADAEGRAGSDDAEEIAQETLLAVWRKAAQFDPVSAGAPAWIYTIARNLRIDQGAAGCPRGRGRP